MDFQCLTKVKFPICTKSWIGRARKLKSAVKL